MQVGVVTALLQKLDVLGREDGHDERSKDKDLKPSVDIVAATEAMLAAWELVRATPNLLLESRHVRVARRPLVTHQVQAAKSGSLSTQAGSPRSSLNIPHSTKTVPTDWQRFEKALVTFRV
jgi:hypothetical protein